MPPEPDVVDTPEEAAALERPPLLVRQPLRAVLDAAGVGSGTIEADPIGDGHSNVTYRLRREAATVVLRRPPRPPLPPSAHDVVREARLLQALADQPVRVPEILLVHEDEATIGGPFYVMAFEEGDVIGETTPERFDRPEARRALVEELVDGLVELHAVDWRSAGLEWLGKPDRYLERQLRRFTGLWEHNATRTLPELEEVTARLRERMPEQREATIVHGDYRLGNVLFRPDAEPRLGAIFDWELSTIGDPLADLGYLTANYAQSGDPAAVSALGIGGVTAEPGYPTRDDVVARYAERSGRDPGDAAWYRALAFWKAAIFLEGSYARFMAGTTDDPFFAKLDAGVPGMAQAALAQLDAG